MLTFLVIMLSSGIYLFRAYSGYIRHETFSFMMSLLAMSLGLRFCVLRVEGRVRSRNLLHHPSE